MGIERTGDHVALLDDETTSDGLGLAVWGFATVVAVILGFASWQYAPPRVVETETARLAPSAEEITGSIAATEHGQTAVSSTRVIGGSRFTPMVLAPSETPASSHDIEALRGELRDLQRRIAQMGLSGDGVSRRLDRLEDRMSRLAGAPAPAEPIGSARAETTTPSDAATATADAVRLPLPRPDTEAPIVTGSLPPKPTTPAKVDRQPPAAAPTRPTVETVAVRPTLPPVAQAPQAATPTPTPTPQAAPPPPPVAVAAIDLGGYRSLATLKKSWSDMTERYAEFGPGIEALARLRETDSGMEARLVAGPYPNQGDAAKACLRLQALGVGCAVTGYTGQPLAAIR